MKKCSANRILTGIPYTADVTKPKLEGKQSFELTNRVFAQHMRFVLQQTIRSKKSFCSNTDKFELQHFANPLFFTLIVDG